MYLGEDGNYYFDEKNVFTYEKFTHIKNQFSIPSLFDKTKIQETYNGQIFNFFIDYGYFIVEKNKNESEQTKLSFCPPQVKFIVKGVVHPFYIFSLEQYDKIIQIFNIKFPWSNDLYLTRDNINDLIFEYENNTITIYEIDIFNENENEIKDKNKRECNDLSKYISLYIKNKINFDEFEEKNFININNFIIKVNSKYNCFGEVEKKNFLTKLKAKIEQGKKEYFFTGPYCIGKTFSLLEFKADQSSENRIAYFNLEALSTQENYFEILAYESRKLFENNEEWKELFLKIKESNVKGFFKIILKLLDLIPKSKCYNKDINYIYILDQIKFKEIEETDNGFKKINEIRRAIKDISNYYLIGCCSINYHGVKKLLFDKWFGKNSNSSGIDGIDLFYVETLQSAAEEKNNSNRYLYSLGNLPRYRQYANNLNAKYINIMCKVIKKKIYKYYKNDTDLILKNLKNLKINESFSEQEEFEKYLDNLPIKYFKIDKSRKKINYSYPLVRLAIEEILNTIDLDNFHGWTNSEREWYFERKVIDKIKTSHILNNYYIDNYYQIKSLYLKEKINNDNFDLKENSFFYFKFCNVRRYDCALYLGNEKSLILVQIALYKPDKEIKKYNENIFTKDISQMQNFLEINNIEVNGYYLLFIFNKDDYQLTNFKLMDEKNFKYDIYDFDKSCFCMKKKELYQIKYSCNENNNINIIDKEEKDKVFKIIYKYNNCIEFQKYSFPTLEYYVYKKMNLKEFIEQVLDDETDLLDFNEIGISNLEKYTFRLSYTYSNRYYPTLKDFDNQKILFVNLLDGIIYFGLGIIKSPYTILKFSSYNILTNEIIKDIKIDNIMQGLLFKAH